MSGNTAGFRSTWLTGIYIFSIYELVIAGYTPSSKNFDALVIGCYQDRELIYAPRTRNGFTPA
jgi:hypothetical protein